MPNKESNPKDVIGCRKVTFSALPWRVLHGVALAMLEGAVKYGRHNYRAVGVRASIYFDACVGRHLSQWWEGEDIDAESGLHHIDKAIACLMVIRDSILAGNIIDDRPYAGSLDINGLNEKAASIIDMHADKTPTHYTKQDEFTVNESTVGEVFTDKTGAIIPPDYPKIIDDNDGWIDWDGGERPVESTVSVDVVIADGEMVNKYYAGMFNWSHDDAALSQTRRIIKYRIHKEDK